jgi:hypothetical protein
VLNQQSAISIASRQSHKSAISNQQSAICVISASYGTSAATANDSN